MTIPAFLGKWVPIFPMYFYKNLLEIMHRNDYGLEFIYSIDETGVTIVPDSEKVIANTGIRSVGRILSAEIAQIIVTRVIMPSEIRSKPYSSSMSSKGTANGSVWIKEKAFLECIEDFIKHVKCPTPTDFQLLNCLCPQRWFKKISLSPSEAQVADLATRTFHWCWFQRINLNRNNLIMHTMW